MGLDANFAIAESHLSLKKATKPWITSLAKEVSLTLNSSPVDAEKHFKALRNHPQLTVNERKTSKSE